MTRKFKFAGVILLFAVMTPTLSTAASCIEGRPEGKCKPDCPMMLSEDAADQVIAGAESNGSCCHISSLPPISNHAVAVTTSAAVHVSQGPTPTVSFVSAFTNGATRLYTPPLVSSSQQALLCVFLV